MSQIQKCPKGRKGGGSTLIVTLSQFSRFSILMPPLSTILDIADIKFLWWWCTQSHFHVKPSLGWVVVMCAWVGVLTIFLNETFLNPPKNYLKILPKLSILDLCLVLAKIIRRYNPLPWWIFLPFRSKQCLNARYRFLWERVCMRKWGVVAFKAILAWAAALQSVAVR